jgi:hypothetical protein
VRTRLGILAALALAGCGDGGSQDRACTEIGCAPDGVLVEFHGVPDGKAEVVVCVENRKCVRQERRGEPLQALTDVLPPGTDRVRVAVIVRKDGRAIARVARRFPVRVSHPNGPDCPPTCRNVRLRFDVPAGRLEEAA